MTTTESKDLIRQPSSDNLIEAALPRFFKWRIAASSDQCLYRFRAESCNSCLTLFGRERFELNSALQAWVQRHELGYVDGTNVYSFASAAPVQTVDPTGLKPPTTGGTTAPTSGAAQWQYTLLKDPVESLRDGQSGFDTGYDMRPPTGQRGGRFYIYNSISEFWLSRNYLPHYKQHVVVDYHSGFGNPFHFPDANGWGSGHTDDLFYLWICSRKFGFSDGEPGDVLDAGSYTDDDKMAAEALANIKLVIGTNVLTYTYTNPCLTPDHRAYETLSIPGLGLWREKGPTSARENP
jgi:hypothetical protein